MTSLLRLPLALVALLGIGYLGACIFLYLRQTRMLFFPLPTVEVTPAQWNLEFEEVWLLLKEKQGDRHQPHSIASVRQEQLQKSSEYLHGWWIPAETRAQGVVLYLHGNGINIGANAEHANRFHQIGFSVLLMDYRGYGQSRGQFPTEAQVYEDAEAMLHYLMQERQISPEQIFVYGHSLGGAIAIDLALQNPNLAGLIIDGSFTSIREMVNLNPTFSLFPINWILTQKFDSIHKVPHLTMPVLFIHGLEDTRVPARMSQALYNAAPQPKQLYLVPGAGHNDVAAVAGLAYLKTVQEFTQQAIEQQIPAQN